MEDEVLTTEELAERWKVKRGTIDDYRKQGLIPTCEGIPVIRFSMQTILELEGVKLDRLSPFERKRLEKENRELRERNEELRKVVGNISREINKHTNYIYGYEEGGLKNG